LRVSPETLYLDLLKKTLTFTLWKEPGIPIDAFAYRRSGLSRRVIHLLARALGRFDLRLVREACYDDAQRIEGAIWPMYADTMIGLKRLDNVQACIETVLRDRIEGDLIETGVWRGGACIFMRAILAAYGITDRKVFVADSFQGLPPPDLKSYPHDRDSPSINEKEKFLAVSQEQVAANFARYGLLDDQVVFLPGWFHETLPTAPIAKLAVLRADGDMYGSTMETLSNLYPKLSPGGYCIIDDYALPRCKRAVDDYRAAQNIQSPLVTIDWTGVFWRKD
jgi:hypothetical protein